MRERSGRLVVARESREIVRFVESALADADAGERLHDFVLDREDVREESVESIRVDLGARVDIVHRHVDADAISLGARAPLDDVACSECTTDVPDRLSPERRGAVSCDDGESPPASQLRRQILDECVGEKRVLRIFASVLERYDRDRGPVAEAGDALVIGNRGGAKVLKSDRRLGVSDSAVETTHGSYRVRWCCDRQAPDRNGAEVTAMAEQSGRPLRRPPRWLVAQWARRASISSSFVMFERPSMLRSCARS